MFGKHRVAGWLVLAVCLLAGRVLHGQEKPDPVIESLDARVSQFLEGVSMGQTQTAYQELLAGSQLLKKTDPLKTALKTLVEKTKELEAKYGRYRAFERVSAKRVGTDMVLLRYLYKCESFPVVWYFTFYRAPHRGDPPPGDKNNWRIIIVRFDTQLELLGL